MMRSKVSRNFVLLAPPGCGEVSANKSANVGALIFIVTLFGSVLIIAYHPPFVQRFLKNASEQVIFNLIAIVTILVALLVGTGNIYIPDYNTWEISMERLAWPTFLKFGLAILFLILAQKIS